MHPAALLHAHTSPFLTHLLSHCSHAWHRGAPASPGQLLTACLHFQYFSIPVRLQTHLALLPFQLLSACFSPKSPSHGSPPSSIPIAPFKIFFPPCSALAQCRAPSSPHTSPVPAWFSGLSFQALVSTAGQDHAPRMKAGTLTAVSQVVHPGGCKGSTARLRGLSTLHHAEIPPPSPGPSCGSPSIPTHSQPHESMGTAQSLRGLLGAPPVPSTFPRGTEGRTVVLTAVEGALIAGCVQGFSAAGRAAGWGPGVCVGVGARLHLLPQDQPADAALDLGMQRDGDASGKHPRARGTSGQRGDTRTALCLPGSRPPSVPTPPGCRQTHRSPCACPAHSHPLHLLMRTAGLGELQEDMWGGGGQIGAQTGDSPQGTGIAKPQGLLGFGGHSSIYLSSTPSLGLGAAQRDALSAGFPFPQCRRWLLPLGDPWKDQYSDSEW